MAGTAERARSRLALGLPHRGRALPGPCLQPLSCPPSASEGPAVPRPRADAVSRRCSQYSSTSVFVHASPGPQGSIGDAEGRRREVIALSASRISGAGACRAGGRGVGRVTRSSGGRCPHAGEPPTPDLPGDAPPACFFPTSPAWSSIPQRTASGSSRPLAAAVSLGPEPRLHRLADLDRTPVTTRVQLRQSALLPALWVPDPVVAVAVRGQVVPHASFRLLGGLGI